MSLMATAEGIGECVVYIFLEVYILFFLDSYKNLSEKWFRRDISSRYTLPVSVYYFDLS